MNASRELDATIAEKVMGWTLRGEHPIFGSPVYATGHSDTLLPKFSTDIAAAWTVVEQIKAEWIVTMEIDEHVTRVGFGKNYASTPIEFSQSAKTTPLAICLAALKAVGA